MAPVGVQERQRAGTDEYACADLMLGFGEYYRTSWASVLGRVKLKKVDGEVVLGQTYTDNTNNWSGDHPIDAGRDPGWRNDSRACDAAQCPVGGALGAINRLRFAPMQCF